MAENESLVMDDAFEQYVKQAELEAKINSRGNSSFKKEYEEIKYAGLTVGVPLIVRAVDGPPNSDLTPYTARKVTIARIVDDNGKQMKVCRPSFQENPNYILNKIISKVKETKWVRGADGKSVKTFPVQEQFPEIYNIIDKNGLKPTDKRAMFDRGWSGSEVIMMNVIDRTQMDWHRANKHTMLLAKSVTDNGNGGYWVEEGVSSFAIEPKFRHIIKSYGPWTKYDMAITRTGDMNNAFNVVCATECPKEVDASVREYISSNTSLTEEENSWEKYDLEKLYRVTSATKIYNRLKNTIKRIDKALGTRFLAELEELVAEEKEMFAKLYNQEDAASATPTTRTTESAPVRRVISASNEVKLPYITDELKKILKKAEKVNGEWKVEWDEADENLAECPKCQFPSPLAATCCPYCGMDYTEGGDDESPVF